MAIPTKCQTSGADFMISIGETTVICFVEIPFDLELSEEEAVELEANVHNAMELVLKPYFKK